MYFGVATVHLNRIMYVGVTLRKLEPFLYITKSFECLWWWMPLI